MPNTEGTIIDLRATDLPETLSLVSGHTIWLDADAAGWGWFVDATPWDYTTPRDQGEQHRTAGNRSSRSPRMRWQDQQES
ncbi:MAG: hypothetical protein L0Y72_23490 [Gemmataceae bacterium]|nr:hypothetical protein [Gemmataceae bacterium]